mgnify:CR=1 FL=1
MASGRDDFVIAFRSAFLKKKDKQKFSLLTLIFLSIIVIIFSNLNLKPIQLVKVVIKETIYRASYIVSIPENYLYKIKVNFDDHMNLYEKYKYLKIKNKNLKQENLIDDFLKLENEKLRILINEKINANEILAKVIIDKESPYLKSIVLNKGTKDNVKIGMAIMDGVYLAGQIIEVNYSNSRALLLSDLNSKIPAVLAPQNIQAVISGTGDDFGVVEHTKTEPDRDLKDIETIIYTSGLGGIFKPGIPIGKILEKDTNKILFFSDFAQLDYVKITSFKIGQDN